MRTSRNHELLDSVEQRVAELHRERARLTGELEQAPTPGAARRLTRRLRRVENDVAQAIEPIVGVATSKVRSRNGMRANAFIGDDDLNSVARMACWQAFLTWDPSKSPFRPWALRHARGAASKAVATQAGLSSHYWEQRPWVLEVQKRLGPEATAQAIATEAKVAVSTVERVLAPPPVYLDATVGEDGVSSLADMLLVVDDADETHSEVAPDVLLAKLREARAGRREVALDVEDLAASSMAEHIAKMPATQAFATAMWALGADITEVAETLGVSRQAATQRIAKGLNRAPQPARPEPALPL